jgi:hypothetical protein
MAGVSIGERGQSTFEEEEWGIQGKSRGAVGVLMQARERLGRRCRAERGQEKQRRNTLQGFLSSAILNGCSCRSGGRSWLAPFARNSSNPKPSASYHCFNRIVRRNFLCGFDPHSGKDYSHRLEWLYQRLRYLARYFALDVLGYAILSNHFHLVLRNRPDRQASSACGGLCVLG